VPAFPEKVPYNLPDILGDEVAEALGLEFVRRGLEKTKKTLSAKNASPSEIRDSNQGAYRINADVTGRTVLVVDDLVSTGTTLSVIAELLRDAGAAKVGAFAATRVLKGKQY
jgi:predicted amidophosphoribosyltransferase